MVKGLILNWGYPVRKHINLESVWKTRQYTIREWLDKVIDIPYKVSSKDPKNIWPNIISNQILLNRCHRGLHSSSKDIGIWHVLRGGSALSWQLSSGYLRENERENDPNYIITCRGDSDNGIGKTKQKLWYPSEANQWQTRMEKRLTSYYPRRQRRHGQQVKATRKVPS